MSKGQPFGVVTFDALFKWVLSAESVRTSFFHAFIPDIVIQSSKRLDDHMHPLQELQVLRDMINHNATTELVSSLKNEDSKVEVHVDKEYHQEATLFLKGILRYFDDIQYSFPKPRFDGTMDFVCDLDTGEIAIVEMQIMSESHWDRRALAYAGAIYGSQLRRKTPWKDIRKVIGVNILGGGLKDEKHWSDTPDQYIRHFKFQEQIHKENPARFLDGIEVIQYSLSNAPKELDTQEKKDWLVFFKDAHKMTEEEVQKEIKTPAVLEAFERARLESLPEQVKKNYTDESVIYVNLSDRMEKERVEGEAIGEARGIVKGKAEGLAEGISIIAKNCLRDGMTISAISKITGLSEEEILLL